MRRSEPHSNRDETLGAIGRRLRPDIKRLLTATRRVARTAIGEMTSLIGGVNAKTVLEGVILILLGMLFTSC